MIYEISIHASHDHREKVDVSNEVEAQKLANTAKKVFMHQLESINPDVNVTLSDENFLLRVGAIYSLRYYKGKRPAKCTESKRRWYYGDFEHTFAYLHNGKVIVLKGEKPERVLAKYCDDGKLKPECDTCEAKFSCFTKSKVEESWR